METIIQDRYGGILQKHFVFYCWTRAGPCIRVREETALPACSVVEMALWWGIDGKEGGVLARGGWLLPVGWTVNTGFYLFLETAFQWSFSLTDGSGIGKRGCLDQWEGD